ncbi:hypothetical protein SCP_0105650 [Sparassis crispa]|uniref:Uncharacterized protein n=1 Tax=Sparassis crispa TaxID=139825 RepID=A0A401G692_9APHY|nr:hypothetical protein SCP_0105650 [Sparassis crispa]GBE77683.1 hypothetical protein SCP_0105650 [Sparassis crispa]
MQRVRDPVSHRKKKFVFFVILHVSLSISGAPVYGQRRYTTVYLSYCLRVPQRRPHLQVVVGALRPHNLFLYHPLPRTWSWSDTITIHPRLRLPSEPVCVLRLCVR